MELRTEPGWTGILFVLLYLPAIIMNYPVNEVRYVENTYVWLVIPETGGLLWQMIRIGRKDIENRRIDKDSVRKIFFLSLMLRFTCFLLRAAENPGEQLFLKEFVWPAIDGAAVGGFLTLSVYVLSRGEWIGGGDVRLTIAGGILLGGYHALNFMGIACLLSVPEAVYRCCQSTRTKEKNSFPFGPYLAVGIWAEFAAGLRGWM